MKLHNENSLRNGRGNFTKKERACTNVVHTVQAKHSLKRFEILGNINNNTKNETLADTPNI